MKPLRYTTDSEKHAYMRMRERQNVAASATNSNENWLYDIIKRDFKYGAQWERQHQWGYRVFDFWHQKLRVAIELDGPEHDASYDQYRDEYNFIRSGIVVIRIRNRNQQDVERAKRLIDVMPTWKDRRDHIREELGVGNGLSWRGAVDAYEYDSANPWHLEYLNDLEAQCK